MLCMWCVCVCVCVVCICVCVREREREKFSLLSPAGPSLEQSTPGQECLYNR